MYDFYCDISIFLLDLWANTHQAQMYTIYLSNKKNRGEK